MTGSRDLNYASEWHTFKLNSNLPNYPSKRFLSKLYSNLPNYPSKCPTFKLDLILSNYPSKRFAFKLDSNLPNYSSKRYISKLDSNLFNYPSKRHTSKLDLKLFKYLSDTAQASRLGFKKIHYRIPVNFTILSNFKPVECSTYKSTIYRGRSGRLLLSIRRVLETSRNLYKESIGLFGATINLYTEVVAKGTTSWTQQAQPLQCNFSFNLFHPLLDSSDNQEKLPDLRYLDLGFRQRPAK